MGSKQRRRCLLYPESLLTRILLLSICLNCVQSSPIVGKTDFNRPYNALKVNVLEDDASRHYLRRRRLDKLGEDEHNGNEKSGKDEKEKHLNEAFDNNNGNTEGVKTITVVEGENDENSVILNNHSNPNPSNPNLSESHVSEDFSKSQDEGEENEGTPIVTTVDPDSSGSEDEDDVTEVEGGVSSNEDVNEESLFDTTEKESLMKSEEEESINNEGKEEEEKNGSSEEDINVLAQIVTSEEDGTEESGISGEIGSKEIPVVISEGEDGGETSVVKPEDEEKVTEVNDKEESEGEYSNPEGGAVATPKETVDSKEEKSTSSDEINESNDKLESGNPEGGDSEEDLLVTSEETVDLQQEEKEKRKKSNDEINEEGESKEAAGNSEGGDNEEASVGTPEESVNSKEHKSYYDIVIEENENGHESSKDNFTEGEEDSMKKQEIIDEEKVARKIGGWAILLCLASMMLTAYQMSENPDGVFASVCRLAITMTGCIFKILLYPCKKMCGNRFNGYEHHLVTTQELREGVWS